MMRDQRRDEAYFQAYIQTQKARIARFEQVFQNLTAQGQEGKASQCAATLSGFYKDLFSAQYSVGEDKEALRETFRAWQACVRHMKSLPWSDAVDLVSLACLFGEDVDKTLPLPWEDALVSGLASGTPTQTVLFPQKALPFLRCLEGEDGPEDLRDYLENSWYADNRDAAWYDTHRRDDDIYCGYWCYAGAAVAKLKAFPPSAFEGVPCFPAGLL